MIAFKIYFWVVYALTENRILMEGISDGLRG